MLGLFLVLCAIIFAYGYVTDSDRVRAMAESYLTNLLGGGVTVGQANLSIFEGLRLENINVRVDESGSPDAVIFSAQTFHLRYDIREMLTGRLVATQIIATNPHLRLSENLESGQWNYQRMKRPVSPETQPSRPGRRMALPEVLLRNARVEYSEMRGGTFNSAGSMTIEAQLMPMQQGHGFTFDFQSRGDSNKVGPVVRGTYDLSSGQVTARLQDFEFGVDIRAMLPAEVRNWWDQHELAGRIDVPRLEYTPSKSGGRSTFLVETDLDDVTLRVKAQEMMSRDEADRRERILRTLRMAPHAWVGSPVHTLGEMVALSPIALRDVAGQFIFTESGIELNGVTASVEDNSLTIEGRIAGYNPHAPLDLKISSEVNIPRSPHYVNSLPPQVREIYNRLRPQGSCMVRITASRQTSGRMPEVSGQIDVVDGQFVFDRFPYPLRGAKGRIVFGRDATTEKEFLKIQGLRGHGIPGGPNESHFITVNGMISPFGPQSEVNIRVEGKGITCEPALRAAFPSDVNESLRKIFTRPTAARELAEGTIPELPVDPNYPAFVGDFVCDVIRPFGLRQRWTVNIDLDIASADGALTVFPYPLRDVSMKLKIRDGYVDIIDAITRQGDASLKIDGRVNFGKNSPMRPALKIQARNVPIDADLLAAMSPQQRAWMNKIGIGGRIDIDGDVFARDPNSPDAARQSSVQYDFAIALRDGQLWPLEGGAFAVSGLAGQMRLAPQRLTISSLSAPRDNGKIDVRGSIAWPDDRPSVALDASATNLELDKTLYDLLPDMAKAGWKQVQPDGTVDAQLSYSGTTDNADVKLSGAYDVLIQPRKLSVKPRVLPYRLDKLQGAVRIRSGGVTLTDISGTHGPARIALSGSGTFDEDSQWNLILSGRDVPVDDDLRQALPEALNTVIDGLNLRGAIAFDFARLDYRTSPDDDADVALPASAPQTQPAVQGDIDFVTRIWLDGARVDVGVPLEQVIAEINLSGSARKGELSELSGAIDASSFTLAGRTVGNFHADLLKPVAQDALVLANMRASLAGGELAGQVDLAFPDDGPSRYAMNLVVRDADVRQIAPQEDQDIQGRLSASLSLEGDWSDISSRRGRGDALVAGKEMYRIPLILGLLQVTNLSLPITTPFNEGTARYSLAGSRVTFEGIELKSNAMTMQGDGYMDFDDKQVRLSFVTDNPNWPRIPIVGDLFRGAKNELLRIHVRGTIEQPTVSAAAMDTFTTTVDEVFKQ